MKHKIFKILAVGFIASFQTLGVKPMTLNHTKKDALVRDISDLEDMTCVYIDNFYTPLQLATLAQRFPELDNFGTPNQATYYNHVPMTRITTIDRSYNYGTNFNINDLAVEINVVNVGLFNRSQNNYYQGYNIRRLSIVPVFTLDDKNTIYGQGTILLDNGQYENGINTGISGNFNQVGVLSAIYGPTSNRIILGDDPFALGSNIKIGFVWEIVTTTSNPAQTYFVAQFQIKYYRLLPSYDEGYTAGQNAGYNTGYTAGYDVGKQDGYTDGYNKGVGEGNSTIYAANQFLSAIVSNIQPILEIQVLPGVSIGTILLIPIVLGLFLLILNFIKN